MNPKFIAWIETLLHVVLDAWAERLMLFTVPSLRPVRVNQSIMAAAPRRGRRGKLLINQTAPRSGVRRWADGRGNCSLPAGVRR